MDSWSVELITGAQFAVRNRTGSDALNVRMSMQGPAVVGIGGTRDWSRTFDQIKAGDGPDLVMKAALGADATPPQFTIEWTSAEAPHSARRLTLNPFD